MKSFCIWAVAEEGWINILILAGLYHRHCIPLPIWLAIMANVAEHSYTAAINAKVDSPSMVPVTIPFQGAV